MRSARRRWLSRVCALGVGLLGLVACLPSTASGPPPGPSRIAPTGPTLAAATSPAPAAPQSPEPSPGASPPATVVRREGSYEGGTYRYAVPPNWNGGVVMYAHGIQQGFGPS